MIRRLGDALEISQGCIQYQDPNTGQWISDPNSPECGMGTMPDDPAGAAAVQDFVASQSQASSSAGLSALIPLPSASIAQAIAGGNTGLSILPITSPVTLPDPLNKFLLYGGIAIVALYMVTESNNSAAARRRR